MIAKNGAGKTSLLNVAAGTDLADEGTLYLSDKITTAYLEQDPKINPDATIFQTVFDSSDPVLSAIREYEECLERPEEYVALHEAQARMDSISAWDYEVRIKQIISKLKLDHLTNKIGVLSGGENKRVALAKVLILEPDFLILDEPTNHLDLDMIEWLEDYLSRQMLSLLMVTHDRYFLEKVCDSILELDNGNLYKYKGNYSYFLEHRMARIENETAEIAKAKNLFRKELEWMRRQPKARTTKAKSRISAFHEVKEKAGMKIANEQVKLNVLERRLGGKILELHNVSKSYGDLKILDSYNYKYKHRERMGVVGKNGSGKTTFLKMITGQEPADSGKIVKGETVVFGHYTQDIHLNENKRVIDIVKEIAEEIMIDGRKQLSASKFLERFLFSAEQQYTKVSKLSGGEKRRLSLLTVLITSPNFLLLDEPTNDLDILTLNILEEFLLEYPGCLLIVSHDRHFMDKLVDEIMVFEGDGKIKLIHGNYSIYRNASKQRAKDQSKDQKQIPAVDKTTQAEKVKTKLTFKEKLELESLETEIEELETRKASLSEELNSGNLGHEELAKLGKELSDVMKELETKSNRWLELSEWA